jgi:hypothetical protein
MSDFNLKLWMRKQGMTQKQLGQKMRPKVNQSTVGRWVKANQVSFKYARQFSKKFDIPIEDVCQEYVDFGG